MDYRVFDVRTDVSACDCTRGCTDTRKRVCTESWLREKNPLPHRGIDPASAAWRSDALINWATSPPLWDITQQSDLPHRTEAETTKKVCCPETQFIWTDKRVALNSIVTRAAKDQRPCEMYHCLAVVTLKQWVPFGGHVAYIGVEALIHSVK